MKQRWFRLNRRAARTLWAGMLLATCSGLSFGWLGEEVLESDTVRFDARIRAIVHAESQPALTEGMIFATEAGSAMPVVILTIVACFAFWVGGRRQNAFVLGGAIVGAGLLSLVLKAGFQRPRPAPYFHLAVPGSFSFPSGHSLVALTFYGILAHLSAPRTARASLRVAVWAVACLMVLVIGFSRIYLGVHYASDVLAGYSAGGAWVAVVIMVERMKFGES